VNFHPSDVFSDHHERKKLEKKVLFFAAGSQFENIGLALHTQNINTKMLFVKAISALSMLLLSNVATAFVASGPTFGVSKGVHFMSATAEPATEESTGTVVKNIRYVADITVKSR
jgi:uncharacterized membrane protein YbjE (DUF340 family)